LESFLKSLIYPASRVRLMADRVALGAVRYRHALLALFSIGYFCDAYIRASRKLFWFDELFTLYISRLPDFRSLWEVLMAGVDFNPPALYLFTKLSDRVLGETSLSVRLPEIVGFWVFCLCLYRFVSVRSNALGGFISMLFPLVTLAYWYAYEARPYAIELGFCGIALVCWQAATDSASNRLWWLLGLGGGLAGMLLTHGYAFLVFGPFVFGELARSFSRRRLDWPIWVTIVLASATLVLLIPMSRALKSILIPATVNHASLAGLLTNYISYLKPAAYVGLGWLILMCVSRSKAPTPSADGARQARLYEIVAISAFLALPALQCLVAKITGAPPIARYSICWIAGPAVLFGLATARRPLVAICTIAILFAQIGANNMKFRSSAVLVEPSVGYSISTSFPDFNQRYQWMEAADKTLPIALLDSFDSLPTAYYAPPSLLSRMTYVTPSRSDLLAFFYERLRKCCNAVLDSPVYLADFISAHNDFLAYGGSNEFTQLNDLRKEGATIEVQNISPDHFLMCVRYRK
jgi:hypothetical protein